MPDLASLCHRFYEKQRGRKHFIKSQNGIKTRTKAFVRICLGFSPDISEKEQKKIADRAAAIVEKVEKGKPVAEEDREVAELCMEMILADKAGCAPIDAARLKIEKDMGKMIKELPPHVQEWLNGVKGLGPVGLAVIIGEAGNLSDYSNPGKLWKRMGLAPLNGKSAKTWRSTGGLTAEDWTWYGYNPRRRSEMWNRAMPIVNAQIDKVRDADGEDTGERVPAGYYGKVYLDRKTYELERDPAMSKMYAHNRASRYMEKRLLKHLWQVWNRQPVAD